MKLTEKKSGGFVPCPEYNGRAVCVDVTPPEMKETKFGPKEKFRVVFEVDLVDENARDNEGKPAPRRWCVWSSGFTTSLNEKSSFRKFLRQWFGRDLTAQELQEFDTESLIGKTAFLVVTHSASEDGEITYANIAACTPHKVGEPLAMSGNFVRKQDREPTQSGGAAAGGDRAQYKHAAQPKPEAGGGAVVGRESWMGVKIHVGNHAGVALGDLDEVAVRKLIENWLPIAKAKAKPTADDKRLIEALGFAEQALNAPPAENADY